MELARLRRELAEARRPKGPQPVPMLTLEAAAELTASYGLTHMNKQWFANQMAKRRMPHTVVSHRRVVRLDVVQELIGKIGEEAKGQL